jgi:hypothetical protein
MSAAPMPAMEAWASTCRDPRASWPRWSLCPAGESQGRLRCSAAARRWSESFEGVNPGRRFRPWSRSVAAVRGLESSRASLGNWPGLAGEPAVPDWVDAARSVELAETIDRSLRADDRALFREYTEESTFKGDGLARLRSASLGMFVMGAVAIAEQIGVPYTRLWPYVLGLACWEFSLIALLMLVFRRGDTAADSAVPRDGTVPRDGASPAPLRAVGSAAKSGRFRLIGQFKRFSPPRLIWAKSPSLRPPGCQAGPSIPPDLIVSYAPGGGPISPFVPLITLR